MALCGQPALSVYGRIVDAGTGSGIKFAKIRTEGADSIFAYSNPDGYFSVKPLAAGEYLFTVSAAGYASASFSASPHDRNMNAGEIALLPCAETIEEPVQAYNDEEQAAPFAVVADNDLYYNRSYDFLFTRFRPRGLDSRYSKTYFNGIDLSDPVSGYNNYQMLAQLGFIAGTTDFGAGITPVEGALGLFGGTEQMRVPPRRSARTKVSYAYSTRSYANRLYVASWLGSAGGWSGVVGLTRRWGRDGYFDGVYTDSWGYLADVSKQIDRHNSLELIVTDSPSEAGQRGPSTREAFALYGSNAYNPYAGYQNGKLRNSRVRTYNAPTAILTSRNRLADRVDLQTSLLGSAAESGYSALGWIDARTPAPDYYRYMPSYLTDAASRQQLAHLWETDPTVSLIDWLSLYRANGNNDSEGDPAPYFVEERITESAWLALASTVAAKLSDEVTLSGGVRLSYRKDHNYKLMADLLGGSYICDVDSYLIDDEYYRDLTDNNLRTKGRKVSEGDTFGYNYNLTAFWRQLWGRIAYGDSRLKAYLGLSVEAAAYQREGLYEKENFPGGGSFGKSEKIAVGSSLFKAGITVPLGYKHHLGANLTYGTLAPYAGDLFPAPRFRNQTVVPTDNQPAAGAELSYLFAGRAVLLRATGYYLTVRNSQELFSYYDDVQGEFCNAHVSGIDRRWQGIEAGADIMVTNGLSLVFAGNLAHNSFTSNPCVTLYSDRSGYKTADRDKAYMNGLRLADSPQASASFTIRYSSRNMFNLSLSAVYASDNYVSATPVRRTARVLALAADGLSRENLVEQERFPDAFVVNMFVSKTFRVRRDDYLSFTLALNNVSNNTGIVYGGYEQRRVALAKESQVVKDAAPFESKYYYGYGSTVFLTASYTF